MQSFAFARGSPVNFWLTDLSEARRDHRGLDLTARTVLKKIYTFWSYVVGVGMANVRKYESEAHGDSTKKSGAKIAFAPDF